MASPHVYPHADGRHDTLGADENSWRRVSVVKYVEPPATIAAKRGQDPSGRVLSVLPRGSCRVGAGVGVSAHLLGPRVRQQVFAAAFCEAFWERL
jgi:hypothetical protein